LHCSKRCAWCDWLARKHERGSAISAENRGAEDLEIETPKEEENKKTSLFLAN